MRPFTASFSISIMLSASSRRPRISNMRTLGSIPSSTNGPNIDSSSSTIFSRLSALAIRAFDSSIADSNLSICWSIKVRSDSNSSCLAKNSPSCSVRLSGVPMSAVNVRDFLPVASAIKRAISASEPLMISRFWATFEAMSA